MHAFPHPQDRLRRLAAMGIDVYVRRELLPEDPASEGDASVVEPPARPEAPGIAPPVAAAEDPGAALADARALLEERTPPPAAPAPVAARAMEEGGERDAAPPAASTVDPGPAPEPEAPPRFRLTALRAGAGLLLVDEALLPYERREVLLRLGDLLRAGLLLRGERAPAKQMETQAFFWPQVEAAHIDQSLPQAVDALGAWVRRCTSDGEGCLIVVAAEADSPAAAPLGALEALPVRRARIEGTFVTAPDAEAHRAAWRALGALAAGGDAP